MEWTQFIIMFLGMVGLFAWNRAEARADYRHMETWTKASIDAMREEMKDFHGRLCSIEEKNRAK